MLDPDTQLMLRFQKGDMSAFKTLITRNQRIVLNLAHKYLASRPDAEDVVQEVFLKVYQAAGSYKPRARFTTWVYRITVNVCLNRIRAARTRQMVSLDAAGHEEDGTMDVADNPVETASGKLEREELEVKVREAMAMLPESQRTAVLLRRFQELSYEEIARTMETTVPAVKSLLARARQRLKGLLAKYL